MLGSIALPGSDHQSPLDTPASARDPLDTQLHQVSYPVSRRNLYTISPFPTMWESVARVGSATKCSGSINQNLETGSSDRRLELQYIQYEWPTLTPTKGNTTAQHGRLGITAKQQETRSPNHRSVSVAPMIDL